MKNRLEAVQEIAKDMARYNQESDWAIHILQAESLYDYGYRKSIPLSSVVGGGSELALKEIDAEIRSEENCIEIEKLAGNIVKEERYRGIAIGLKVARQIIVKHSDKSTPSQLLPSDKPVFCLAHKKVMRDGICPNCVPTKAENTPLLAITRADIAFMVQEIISEAHTRPEGAEMIDLIDKYANKFGRPALEPLDEKEAIKIGYRAVADGSWEGTFKFSMPMHNIVELHPIIAHAVKAIVAKYGTRPAVTEEQVFDVIRNEEWFCKSRIPTHEDIHQTAKAILSAIGAK